MSFASGKVKAKKAKKSSAPVHEDEIEEERENDELQAEMRALEEIRNNKALSGGQHIEQTEAMLEQHKNQNQNTSTQFSYNKKALQMACEGLASSQLPFLETLCVSSFPVSEHDDNDDLEREMAFYNQSLLAVQEGRRRLTELGVPTRRPPDFFCEHAKSDTHMGRIKDRLILESRKIESFEARKQQEISRKYEREIQAAKRKIKATEEADDGNKPKFHRGKDEGDEGGRSDGRSDKKFKGGNGDKSRKRQVMDKKYGSGIKDRMKSKMNDKKSLNDLSQFHPKGGRAVRRSSGSFSGSPKHKVGRSGGSGGGGGGSGGNKSGKPNRPGKEARSQKRKSNSSA